MVGSQLPSAASLLNPKGSSNGGDSNFLSASSLNTFDNTADFGVEVTAPRSGGTSQEAPGPSLDSFALTAEMSSDIEIDRGCEMATESENMPHYANTRARISSTDPDENADFDDCDLGRSRKSRTNSPTPRKSATPAPGGGLALNPSQLLNPRSNPISPGSENSQFGQTISAPKNSTGAHGLVFQFGSAQDLKDDESEEVDVGVSSFIERSHNLTAREDNPAKRQKLAPDDLEKRSKFSQADIKGGGIISEHIKEKRREAIRNGDASIIEIHDTPEPSASADPASESDLEVVDLTLEDASDTKVKDPEEHVVCFGKLEGANVSMHQIPEHKDHKGWTSDQRYWKALTCKLWRIRGNSNFVIHVRDHHNKIFGTIDLRVARALAPLLDSDKVFPGFRVDARLDPHLRAQNTHFGDSISDRWPITLNVYGQRKHAQLIGGELRKRNVFLGAATGLPYGTEYYNPHAQERFKQSHSRASRYSGSGRYVTRTNEEVEKDINSVFGRVKNHEELMLTAAPPCVLTPLLPHQQQALTFMAEREAVHEIREDDEGDSKSLWRMKTKPNGAKSYYNVITGNEERDTPPPVLGGILADQMGLGKTLEALAHFASTIEVARALNGKETTSMAPDGTKLENIGATLLICPKNVMSNWEDQMCTHLRKGSVSSIMFYGPNRTQDVADFREHDLVITTYSTVSSELNRRSQSILKKANFFRIILDEGHFIREQSTMQSRAVCDLHATRRWVLTGTPVQNKLEDLGALVKFLKVKPFDVPSAFSQYIIAPLKGGDVAGIPRLRTLVDVITLRRLKDRIDLLPREDTLIKLEFSADEKTFYNWVNQDARHRVRMMDDTKRKGGRQMGGILRLISCLRMISDHGKELVREEELPDTKGISTENPLVVDDDEQTEQPPLLATSAYEMYHLMAENDANNCILCARKVVVGDEDDESDKAFGIMLRCYDLVCNECMKRFRIDREKEAINGRYSCPLCNDTIDFSFFELNQSGLEDAETSRKEALANPVKAKRLARYEKPHTKTWALIAELDKIAEENFIHDHDPPIKSVVFTEWTSHLDLLEIALRDHCPNLTYVRLDGSMSRRQQTIAMDKLRDDSNVTLMLVSIKAGGVGINLTSASRVFVMEPQWNPAAEAQAVDRVHRLGQKRAVKVTRFIMADSIEEQIAKRQTMKKDLADLSMNRKAENLKDKMERFRELFR